MQRDATSCLTPSKMLRDEFLRPMALTPCRLAKDIGVPLIRITASLAGRSATTGDTGLRLDRYFGFSEGCWLGLQTECDIPAARRSLASELAAINPRQAAGLRHASAHFVRDYDSAAKSRSCSG